MRLILFSFLAVFATTFVSCKGKSAMKFNNTIIGYEDALLKPMERTEASITRLYEAGNWDSMALVSKQMEDLVNEKIANIRAMDVPSVTGGEEFKTAALRYFSFIQEIYARYQKLAHQPTEEARNEELQRFSAATSQREMVSNTFQAAQQKFAKANGLRLQIRN